MRRKVRVNRSKVSVKSEFNWAVEPCEQRMLLSATIGTILPILTTNYPNTGASTPSGTTGLTSPAGGITPAQMRGAYGITSIDFDGVTGDGTGQTISIVDAYDDPNALADLQTFDAQYGLVNPPSFLKLNQNGQAAPLPGTDPAAATGNSWEIEESLDIEWAHVIAPQANIVLFETNDQSQLFTGVLAADNYSATSVVSMSWSTSEFQGETTYDSMYFTTPAGHKPITWFAAAGDNGIYAGGNNPSVVDPQYPAASPNVVAVGGTTLTVNGTSYGGETGWGHGVDSGMQNQGGGSGGGISAYESQPGYQSGVVTQSTTNRTYPDVAMDGDPESGVSIYDSFDYGTGTGWIPSPVGGTSLATPMFAAVIAIADQGRVDAGANTLDGPSQTLPMLYSAPSGDFHDITQGNNGYAAGVGYDLVTGIGSPVANNLVQLFQAHIGAEVFDDINANGILDNGEPGLAGVTVQLMTPGADGIVGNGDDTLVATTTTDSNGLYSFSNVVTGTYYLHFSTLANFHISPEGAGTDPTLDSSVSPTTGDTVAFGYTTGTTIDNINCGQYTQSLSITDVSADEGNSGLTPFTFSVTVNGLNTAGVSIPYTTENGTATTADNDYVAQSGTLTIPAGSSTGSITVQVIGDTKIENNETFFVVLTNPAGFSDGNLVGTGTIINDDFPTVSVSSYSLLRPDAGTVNYPFVFTLSAAAPFEVDVPYTTRDVTAVGSIDYAITAGTLIFPANSTAPQTVEVPVDGGTNPTLDKTFQIVAETSPTVTATTASVGTGTILSNSPPAVSVTGGAVTESLTGLAYLPFVVSVAPALTGTVSVNYATADGTAVAGTDYVATSGTVVFTPGQLSRIVEVPVERVFTAEVDKTLTLNLSNLVASGTVTLATAAATGTIHDLEVVALSFTASEKATYTDYLDNKVTVSLAGPGTGLVQFLGSSSVQTNAFEIDLSGTTSASALTIKTPKKAQTGFTNITSDSSLGSINGKTTNLQGAIDIAGSLNSLVLNYISASSITVGAGTGELAVDFNRALDTSITSAIPIRSITAGAYLNTDNIPDEITAPSIGAIDVKGTFGGSTNTTSVALVHVGGAIEDASIRATDSIGSITAGSIAGSTLFAGVAEAVSTLPTSAFDFSNQKSRIASVKVKSGAFSDSLIAGWSLGKLSLGAVDTSSATAFGVTASKVASLQSDAASTSLLDSSNEDTVDGAFSVYLI